MTEVFDIPLHRIRVLPPCIAPVFCLQPGADQSKRRDGRPYFLAVGTLEPRKNIPRLLDAWRALQAPHDLVLVGRWGWMYESLRTRLDMLGQHHIEPDGTETWEFLDERRVIRKEYVPAGELASWYRSAEALVYPSLFEGFGLPVLEAMSCGCPILTSWRSPMEEIAGDSGWYFDPEDEDTLLATLQRFLKDPGERNRRILLGLERAPQFNLARFTEGLYAAYQEALT